LICSDASKLKVANALIASGAADAAIAAQIGLSGSANAARMCVSRHRNRHILAPAAALATAAAKGKDVADKRKEMVKAAEAGDQIATFLGLEEITRDLRKVSKQLGRVAKVTEQAGQYGVMTGVVAQQHKSMELRGKLGNLPGFTPPKSSPGGGAEMPTFNLVINIPGAEPERMNFSPAAQLPDAPMLDFHVVENASVPDAPEDTDPGLQKLRRAFGHS
jgi:hypothetical protein